MPHNGALENPNKYVNNWRKKITGAIKPSKVINKIEKLNRFYVKLYTFNRWIS